MTNNRSKRWLPIPRFSNTYKEAGFEEDAERIVSFYRDRGYLAARVGQPSLRTLEDSPDGKTRWVALDIPVTEGGRYRVGALTVEGSTSVPADYLLSLFKTRKGDLYSEKRHSRRPEQGKRAVRSTRAVRVHGLSRPEPQGCAGADSGSGSGSIVDITLRVQEGPQYLINRITFAGNTTTRDQVIRRELRIYEGGVFNTEALKMSIRRLNQLGYFKPLEEQKSIQVDKTPNQTERVDLTLKLEEQNRNQLSFGAGMSQLYGVFVNASYATTNFLGKGETLSLNIETGSRSNNYQASLTEPYMFDRPISMGASLFSRKTDYFLGTSDPEYSEVREGAHCNAGNAPARIQPPVFAATPTKSSTARRAKRFGRPARPQARQPAVQRRRRRSRSETASGTTTYARTTALAPTFNFAVDEGRHVESRVEPTFVFDTVDNPLRRAAACASPPDRASPAAHLEVRSTICDPKPNGSSTFRTHAARRSACGARRDTCGRTAARSNFPTTFGIFSAAKTRFAASTCEPSDPLTMTNQLIGGNKFVLFNAEYYLDLHSKVRALAFHDAGQAFDETRRINLRELRTSSGAELRVVLPVFNMPFRLIYAWNTYRDAFQPRRSFRFAVGTTF